MSAGAYTFTAERLIPERGGHWIIGGVFAAVLDQISAGDFDGARGILEAMDREVALAREAIK